ncbi:D-alanyl-D-alanine carboxypeptidase family protein [Microbacterium sp. B2969]|uniref:D-alanyl-D-alanine carboxypeptidase family protein n=1 Tax=Microbacterium alkaliflavum TaxID=3248839 RepID=A0ABW7Q1U7_9MICO
MGEWDHQAGRGPAITTHDQLPDEFADLVELMDEAPEGGVDPLLRTARRRRGLIVAAIVIAVVLVATGGYTGWALTAPPPVPVVQTQDPSVPRPAAAALALPAQGASAIAVTGADEYLGPATGAPWATSGTDDPRPIASISKLITALVILDAKPLADADDPGPTIWFDKAAHDLYDKYYVMGATIAAMPIGSSMSERDALATMLIPSACNYAEAVSTWAFGSQSGFLDATRRWLGANGLTGTTIVEPTGISPRNSSTPSDLMKIGALAAAQPTIEKIAATSSLSLPGPGFMANTNDLLGSDGVTGLKTGNLGAGNFNLLYTASLDVGAAQPLSVTGVLLGGATHDAVNRDVVALLDSIRAGFRTVPLATAGQPVGSFTTPWGSRARMVIAENASIFTWSDTPITRTMTTRTPTAYEDDEVIGSITWTAGPNTTSVPIEIEGTIAPPTEWWRLTHPLELGAE